MLTVVGTGIAAMSSDALIADTAAFLSLISGSMGLFLLLVKMVVLFESHFKAQELPEKKFLPSFLIVIPNITLYTLSAFRLGHFLEQHHGFHLGAYFYLVLGFSFAFEIWYLIFGLVLLRDYFKQHHFNDFYLSQWSFICPFVAFAVLGSFVYAVVFSSFLIYGSVLLMGVVAILFYAELLYKHFKCSNAQGNKINCRGSIL